MILTLYIYIYMSCVSFVIFGGIEKFGEFCFVYFSAAKFTSYGDEINDLLVNLVCTVCF